MSYSGDYVAANRAAKRDAEIAAWQDWLWKLPHWAHESKVMFGSVAENQRVAVFGTQKKAPADKPQRP